MFIPLYRTFISLGYTNSLGTLILAYPTFLVPFVTWLLMGFFRSIPRELEEAALVDGATRVQAMVRVVLPLAAPGLLAAGLFCFTLSWNEFLYALIFIADDSLKTLPGRALGVRRVRLRVLGPADGGGRPGVAAGDRRVYLSAQVHGAGADGGRGERLREP